MPNPPSAHRVREDACPGVMRLTQAVDGSLARVRLVGGFLSAQGISVLADAAAELGDGRLELTSRGNVQLRGLAPDAGGELGRRLHTVGLWPSASHERVRNILASPLAGLDRDSDVSDLVRALDEALCASPRLAELSGRFLFAVDDGRGDVADLGADVLITRSGSDPVGTALALADAFLDERAAQNSDAWRIADLVDGAARVHTRAGIAAPRPTRGAGPPTAGVLGQFDGGCALVVAVPLGRLGQAQARWLADVVGQRPVRVTPWRSVVIPDVRAAIIADAAALGFGVTPDSAWLNVSACAGRPGCAKALADVQTDARAGLDRWPGRAVHWSGCGRRCGRPARTGVDVVATEAGYLIENDVNGQGQ
jgi:precorrin-3B synthase